MDECACTETTFCVTHAEENGWCGGCRGLGSHAYTCSKEWGIYRARLREGQRHMKSLGDLVGPNDMALSNALWAMSERLGEAAK